MSATIKFLLMVVSVMSIQGLANAGTERDVPGPVKAAAWERVGDAGDEGKASAVRAPAMDERQLQVRKAEMVRRMFWILLAHR